MMKRVLSLALVIGLALLTLSCGGSRSSEVGRQTVGPSLATVTLKLSNAALGRVAGANVNAVRLTGLSWDATVVFGPAQRARAAELSFQLPVTTSKLLLEYLAGDQVVGVFTMPVQLAAGQDLVITDPDFTDGASALVGLKVSSERTVYPLDFLPRVSARGNFADGTSADLSGSVSWSLSGNGQISSDGLITGSQPGSVSVRGTLQGFSDELSLTITGARLSALDLSPSPFRLASATSKQMVATAEFDDGTRLRISDGLSWSSALSAIASVDDHGVVSGQTPGSTAITASYLSRVASAEIWVTAARLSRLEVSPGTISVVEGKSVTFRAVGHFNDGTQQELSDFVTWGSNNPVVASVDRKGVASALAAGQAQIIANDPETGMMASGTLLVTALADEPPVATNLAFTTQPPSSLKDGQTFSVTVTVLDQHGQPFSGQTGDVTLSLGTAPSLSRMQTTGDSGGTEGSGVGSGVDTGSGTQGSGVGSGVDTGSGTQGSGVGSGVDTGSGTQGSGVGSGVDTGSGTQGSGVQPVVAVPFLSPGLYGTLTRPLVQGVATFDDLRVVGSGSFILSASRTPLVPGASNVLNVTTY